MIKEAISISSAFSLGADEHETFKGKLDSGKVAIPSHYTVRRVAVKLDYLFILYERRLWRSAMEDSTQR